LRLLRRSPCQIVITRGEGFRIARCRVGAGASPPGLAPRGRMGRFYLGGGYCTKAPLGEASQQLPTPAVPVQLAAVVSMQLATVQSPSTAHVRVGSLVHAPFTPQVPDVDCRQATTSFSRPQVDRALQRTTVFRQRRLSPAARAASLVACATQRTYCPWLPHDVGAVPTGPEQGHASVMAAVAESTTLGSQVLRCPPPLPWWPPPGIAPARPPISSSAAAVLKAVVNICRFMYVTSAFG